MRNELTAGVIIATRNRRSTLERALRHWERSTRKPEQFVVVDSSIEAERSRSLTVSAFPRIFETDSGQYLLSKQSSLTVQRNMGVDYLSTDVAVFVDDDALIFPDYLERIMQVFESDEEGRIGGVQGANADWTKMIKLCLRDFSRPLRQLNARIFLNIRQAYPRSSSIPLPLYGTCFPLIRTYHLWGACMSFRRKLLLQERFDEHLKGYAFLEDFDISFRIGRSHALAIKADARVHHAVEPTARMDDVRFFLMSWVNPAYLIEKLLPFPENRRPLVRKLRQERLLSRIAGRAGRTRRYDVALAMVQILQDVDRRQVIETYLRLQEYVLGTDHDVGEPKDFESWWKCQGGWKCEAVRNS